jgi:hypothetical protein
VQQPRRALDVGEEKGDGAGRELGHGAIMPRFDGPTESRAIVFRVTVDGLPGAELIRKGVDDLAQGVESAEALLVSIGAPRLARLGIEVGSPLPSPEHRLYELLRAEDADGAHSRYNALIRRLVSFERAAECAS